MSLNWVYLITENQVEKEFVSWPAMRPARLLFIFQIDWKKAKGGAQLEEILTDSCVSRIVLGQLEFTLLAIRPAI